MIINTSNTTSTYNKEILKNNNKKINNNNNINPRESESPRWRLAKNSRTSWVGRALKSLLATFLGEGKLKSRLRKALYPLLATLLREKKSNIKFTIAQISVTISNKNIPNNDVKEDET